MKTVKVTSAQKYAAQTVIKRAEEKGEEVSDAIRKVANAKYAVKKEPDQLAAGDALADAVQWIITCLEDPEASSYIPTTVSVAKQLLEQWWRATGSENHIVKSGSVSVRTVK